MSSILMLFGLMTTTLK